MNLKTRKKTSGGISAIRELVRIRDNHTCQLCFKKWFEDGIPMRFDVHHLDPSMESTTDYEYDKNNTDKMVTLCHKCHMSQRHNIDASFFKLKSAIPVYVNVVRNITYVEPRVYFPVPPASNPELAKEMYRLYTLPVTNSEIARRLTLKNKNVILPYLRKHGYLV